MMCKTCTLKTIRTSFQETKDLNRAAGELRWLECIATNTKFASSILVWVTLSCTLLKKRKKEEKDLNK